MAGKQISASMVFGGKVSASFGRANRAVASRLERTAAIVEKLKKRQTALNNRIAGARKASSALPELQKRFARVDKVADRLAKRQLDLAKKIKKAAAAGKDISVLKKRYSDARRTAKTLAKEQTKLRKKIATSKAAAKDIEKLGKSYAHVSQRVKKFEGALERAQRKQRRLSQAAGLGRGALGAVGAAARVGAAGLLAAAAAATAAAVAFGRAVNSSSEWAQTTSRMARRVGLSVTQMQAFEGMGARLGFEADQIGDAIADMGEHIAEGAQEPRGTFGDLFRRLGLDARNLVAMNPEEQLERIGDALRRLPTDQDRLFAARELGGDESADALLELTRDGGRAFRDAMQEATRGAVSEDGIQGLTRLRERMGEIRHGASQLTRLFVAEVAPALFEAFGSSGFRLKDLRAGVQSFGQATARAIKRATKWWRQHGGEVRSTASSFGRIFGAVGRLVTAYDRMAGSTHDVNGEAVQTVSTLQTLAGHAEFVAFAINGWAQLFERISMKSDELKRRVQQLPATMDKVKAAAKGVWDTMKNKAREALDWIRARVLAMAQNIATLAVSFTPPWLRGGAPTGSPSAPKAPRPPGGSSSTNNTTNDHRQFRVEIHNNGTGTDVSGAEGQAGAVMGALRQMRSGAATVA